MGYFLREALIQRPTQTQEFAIQLFTDKDLREKVKLYQDAKEQEEEYFATNQ